MEATGAGRQMEKLQEDLSKLQLSEELMPESCRINSPKEEQLLETADNFHQQYVLLHPDSKPLLLCPVNECGVRKFISTTVQPVASNLGDLFYWQDCSSFVADFLSLRPLEPPTELPRQLFSPTYVLSNQKATCFESSTLLCSMLLARNYHAYCVSGYTSREMCLLDQSLQQCPLLDTEEVQEETSEQRQQQKDMVRLLGELGTASLMEQERQEQEAAEGATTALLQKELQEQIESRRLPDPLEGLRIHCWVLVLSGKHDIEENFFIDPLTGSSFPTNDKNFQSIESVWDNYNCYINRQRCIDSCKQDVCFNFEDRNLWEKVLEGAISQQQLEKLALRREKEGSKGMAQLMQGIIPRKFVLHSSWVSYINISREDLKKRFPGGKKETRFRRAKLERFSPTVTKDGLIRRLTTYKDLDCTEVTRVKEWYKNRSDYLEEREINKVENVTTERFRSRGIGTLLFHRWKPVSSGIERMMRFETYKGLPGLRQRVLSPQFLEETFLDRSDFLYFRRVTFRLDDQPLKADHPGTPLEDLGVLKVVERFHRNQSKPANDHVAQRVFLLPDWILLTYHLMDHYTIPSARRIRRINKNFPIPPDLCSEFQADRSLKPLGPLSFCRLLDDMNAEEYNVALQIKESLMEVENFLASREQQEKELIVFSSVMDRFKCL
ncbi:dynein regulatory complex subunit 7-like [Cyprinodon tularosa]|uniref:dynein regulatory complex subunit 7-like n=1 Tax=Cyprinodon tularosa TaxID=77115 RepID=UPI0018E210E9|nr:dynein regulatory complex subunit 7-like [Cyprinodon tularosa]